MKLPKLLRTQFVISNERCFYSWWATYDQVAFLEIVLLRYLDLEKKGVKYP